MLRYNYFIFRIAMLQRNFTPGNYFEPIISYKEFLLKIATFHEFFLDIVIYIYIYKQVFGFENFLKRGNPVTVQTPIPWQFLSCTIENFVQKGLICDLQALKCANGHKCVFYFKIISDYFFHNSTIKKKSTLYYWVLHI